MKNISKTTRTHWIKLVSGLFMILLIANPQFGGLNLVDQTFSNYPISNSGFDDWITNSNPVSWTMSFNTQAAKNGNAMSEGQNDFSMMLYGNIWGTTYLSAEQTLSSTVLNQIKGKNIMVSTYFIGQDTKMGITLKYRLPDSCDPYLGCTQIWQEINNNQLTIYDGEDFTSGTWTHARQSGLVPSNIIDAKIVLYLFETDSDQYAQVRVDNAQLMIEETTVVSNEMGKLSVTTLIEENDKDGQSNDFNQIILNVAAVSDLIPVDYFVQNSEAFTGPFVHSMRIEVKLLQGGQNRLFYANQLFQSNDQDLEIHPALLGDGANEVPYGAYASAALATTFIGATLTAVILGSNPIGWGMLIGFGTSAIYSSITHEDNDGRDNDGSTDGKTDIEWNYNSHNYFAFPETEKVHYSGDGYRLHMVYPVNAGPMTLQIKTTLTLGRIYGSGSIPYEIFAGMDLVTIQTIELAN